MKKKKQIIGFRSVRKHEHRIDFSDVNLDMLRDVPNVVELQPIQVVDTLNS